MNTYEVRMPLDAFQRIWEGHRHHDARPDYPLLKINDMLLLKECDPDTNECTQREMHVIITDISRAPDAPEGWMIISIQHISVTGEACCTVRKERFG